VKKITCGLISLICIFSTQAQAGNLQVSLKACAQKSDSLKRLVCYDELATSIDLSHVDVSKDVSSVSKKTEAVAASQQIVDSTTVNSTVPSEKAVQTFGAERAYAKKEQVEEVRFTVKSVTKNARGKLKITFENGQVWQQKDSDSYTKFSQGDLAVIKRGVFDSFYMKKENSNRTIRVKRIK